MSDVPGSLKSISEMGYTAAETASYDNGKFYGLAPAEFRKIAEDFGIRVTGAHLGRADDPNNKKSVDDWWKQACEAQAAVGGEYIVVPSIGFGQTLKDLDDICSYFNRTGEIAQSFGLKFGYHNHSHEFGKQEGKVIENYLIENTDPDKVMFELDVYWATKGGVNPSAYIQKYAGRFPLLHIKDEFVIGESGDIDFKAIFDQFYKNGMKDYVVEIEMTRDVREKAKTDNDAAMDMMFEAARKSAEYLKKADFVK